MTIPFPLAQVTDSPLVLDWAPRPTPPPHEPPRPGRLAKVSVRLEQKGGGGGGRERWPERTLVGDLLSAREMQDIPLSGEETVFFPGRGPVTVT